jgi:hypothetical protein
MLKKLLLGCGVVSSAWYVAMDVAGSMRYEGYSYRDYTFSELLAYGAPTRTFMLALLALPYGALVGAFAAGVWRSAGQKRAGRIAAAMLAGYVAVGVVTPAFFAAGLRGAEATLRTDLHGPMTGVQSLFLLAGMGFAAALFGRHFRWYTIGTMVALLVFGGIVGLYMPRLIANEPTPWLGVLQRVNIYGTMLWVAVLAGSLLRAHGTSVPRHLDTPAVTPQMVPR